jgi:hypothetical protein
MSTVSLALAPLIIGTAPSIVAEDSCERRRGLGPCSAAQMEERSPPAGGNIMTVMFSEARARGLRAVFAAVCITPEN